MEICGLILFVPKTREILLRMGVRTRILNIMDEYTRECLLSFASRRITSSEVVEFLAELFCSRELPVYIRSDNGSEFTARKVCRFIRNLGTLPAFIEPGSPLR